MTTTELIVKVTNRLTKFDLEELKKEAHLYASETGFEFVVLDNGGVWANHWVKQNPQVLEKIIYSTLA